MVQELRDAGFKGTIIGLTGVFGSGKSTVAEQFAKSGALVLNADLFAHEALEPGTQTYSKVKEVFPESIEDDGRVDRKKLGEIVFQDEQKKNDLESWIHPYVFQRIRESIMTSDNELVVIEIPLLFETAYEKNCNYTVAVTAPEEEIFSRLEKKGFPREKVILRNRAQMPGEEKRKRADFSIDNSHTVKEIEQQVKSILEKINKDSKGVS